MLKSQKIIKNSVEGDMLRVKISRDIAEYIKKSVDKYSHLLGKDETSLKDYNDVILCLNLILEKEIPNGNSTTSTTT